jgi:PAS domain S-box-containing protein
MSALPPIYFERLLEDSPDIVVAVDRRGEVIFYNDGARTALGYTPDEVRGQHVQIFYPSIEHARAVMKAMRDPAIDGPGKVKNFQTVFVTRGGEKIAVAISGSLIYDDQGAEIGSIGFAKDLREIHRQDQLVTLGEIAIGVAHEINNPLAAILNNVALLGHDVRQDTSDGFDVQSERLDSIESSVGQIRRIVNRLTDMAGAGEYDTREYLPGARMADLRSPGDIHVPQPGEGAFQADRASVVPQDRPLDGLEVLVVDDDLAVCHSAGAILETQGCIVTTATSGAEAQRILATRDFDLVLSDVVMPDVDGYDVYMTVRERYPETPVVLMTAFFYDRDHVIKRSKLAGLDGVLFKKPIDPARLVSLVRERCGR